MHNAGFVPPCHQPRHVRASLAHPFSLEEGVAEGKEKPLSAERQRPHLGGCTHAGAGIAAKAWGAPGMEPVCECFPVPAVKG